jgi:hypothetical protein
MKSFTHSQVAVMFQNRIRTRHGSHLGQDAGYMDWMINFPQYVKSKAVIISKITSRHFLSQPLFIHYVLIYYWPSLPASPLSPARRDLQTVRDIATSLKLHHHLLSLRSSSDCLRLLPLRLLPSIFPSITRVRRQYLRKHSPPIHLAISSFLYVGCPFRSELYKYLIFDTTGPTVLLHDSNGITRWYNVEAVVSSRK